MTKLKAPISWSSGKDCCFAMLRASDSFDIVTMVTMFNEDGSRPAMVAAQAARLATVRHMESIGVDPCGEFGEYHTIVTNCPRFLSPLAVVTVEVSAAAIAGPSI